MNLSLLLQDSFHGLMKVSTAFATATMTFWDDESRNITPKKLLTHVIQDPTAKARPHIPPKPPEDWEKQSQSYEFKGKNKKAELFIARATNPKGIIFLSPGWKSTAADHEETVSFLVRNDYTVMVMPLIDPGEKGGSLPESIHRLQTALMNENSILYQEARKNNLPVFALTHSTSGNLYRHALKLALEKHGSLPDNFQDVIHMAACFAPATASPESPITEKIYFDWHVPRNPHENTIRSPFGRFYHLANGDGDKILKEHPDSFPTQIQVGEIRASGLISINDKKGRIIGTPSEVFAFAWNDIYSCSASSAKVADNVKADIWDYPKGGHHVQRRADFLDRMLARFDKKVFAWQQKMEDHQYNFDVSPLSAIPPAIEDQQPA